MIEGINCPNCGAPADNAGAKICQYCETPFLLASASSLQKISDISFGKYADFYKKITKDDPDYLISQISLVIVYIKRKLYPLADSLSKRILEEYPDESDSYLWRSIALAKNGDIRKIKISTAKEITQLLQTGSSLGGEEKLPDFAKVATYLKEGYFDEHGIEPSEELEGLVNSLVDESSENSVVHSIMEL